MAKQLGLPFPGGTAHPSGVVYDVYPAGGPWWTSWNRRHGAWDTNSIVFAVVGWVGRTFPEAPLRVYDRSPTGDEVVFDHELELLLEQPNEYYGGPLLWMATLADYFLTGNSYWLKVRDPRGRVRELWWLPSVFVEPYADTDQEYVSGYEYRPKAEPLRVPREDVVHLRYGLDPENPRKGKSPFAAVVAEILTDQEAALFTQVLLKNLGVPGVILSPDEAQVLTDDELEALKAKFMERFGGTHRGEPLVLTSKTKVDVLSFSPEQLNLREIRKIPEERITAAIGLPAIVAGMGAGLDRSTFANMAEAREAAYEQLIIPMQRMIASDVQVQLLPDFAPTGAAGRRTRQRCAFDTATVRVLQEDQDKLVTRLVAAVEGGVLTPNEARSRLGLPDAEDPQADRRLMKAALIVVPEAAEEAAPPRPSPPPPLPPGQSPAPETSTGEDEDAAALADAVLEGAAAKALPGNVARWMNGTAVGRSPEGRSA